MPWAAFDLPSAAIGALSGFLKIRRPEWLVCCHHENVDVWSSLSKQYAAISRQSIVGELVYLGHLYPESLDRVRCSIEAETREYAGRLAREGHTDVQIELAGEEVTRILNVTGQHLLDAMKRLAGRYDVVGFTTSYAQLFPSLCLSKLLKASNPSLRVVLGGRGLGPRPEAILSEYPFVDFVVCGEGEIRLLELLTQIEHSQPNLFSGFGVLGQAVSDCAESPSQPAVKRCIDPLELDELPDPDYDDYYSLADNHNILSYVPIEGSRGCWWDRRAKTDRYDQACYFCGVNGKSKRREKSSRRVAQQMGILAQKHENVRFRFVDNNMGRRGGYRLAGALEEMNASYRFFLEVHATTETAELLQLMDAGCSAVQIGSESLSTPHLNRLNKGTTTIQNLRVMRACFELGIRNYGNLIVGFPESTKGEVEETRRNILRYAIAYEPLSISQYTLDVDSVVYTSPKRFGVVGIRNAAVFRKTLPRGVSERLTLPWTDYDLLHPTADWDTVVDACAIWKRRHSELCQSRVFSDIRKPLFYFDGGHFLEIIDRRSDLRTMNLDQLERDIYLYCMEIRSTTQISRHFSNRCSEDRLAAEILPAFLAEDLMFEEDGRVLSLAVAWRPELAVKRIREQYADDSVAADLADSSASDT